MYLVVIAWMYVVLMMSAAEATAVNGTVLGAIVTFVLYGLLPMGIVVYIMSTPARKRKIKAREAAEMAAAKTLQPSSIDPDAGGHATGAAENGSVPPVGKEP
ncbi:hypothetical protein LPB72_07655 [Hydrogenophaga crassostreae]|uniref:Transmembrane protein n=1 Tax=Hydrogenophaga crassostreae TaxID=1763535 RepID=A0ABX2U9C1_9BURK|nr:hypothetical protein [Hydrogenophaga crassostreae]OAD42768.1 hypothetical protein LPB72_07655 [Hydrogenophaga crassostreae]